jgi:hypothetical protein
MNISMILHKSKIIVFQDRNFICEAYIPNRDRYLSVDELPNFVNFFTEHAIFEPATSETIIDIFEKWKSRLILD